MKIKLKKTRLYTNLIFGFVWVIIAIISIIGREKYQWTDFAYLVVGCLYLGHYLYDSINQYLIIDNGIIRKNVLYDFSKSIHLNDIKSIKKFAGVYTLKTDKKELKINTNLIDPVSLEELNKLLGELDLEPNKTIFSK
ncbi:hypothetical protein [Carboxylicivirga caseinilyticus]|uniref:hypothetical protein n=1 Tax=Carboxylicivirga caseinilyticus TaxID=3417572 RepID=UPI003D331205|nr:hypothetical protein [Marinilabiliaceae bacterium A049]